MKLIRLPALEKDARGYTGERNATQRLLNLCSYCWSPKNFFILAAVDMLFSPTFAVLSP